MKGSSGKSKGRVPAHQNTTAWRHNPKSKKTAKILASPISGVCRRCHQKLEWRKQYRKYKPRTVPGTCNLCRHKNVLAAYHTICDNCSRSHVTSVARLREFVVGSTSTPQHDDGHDQGLTSTSNVPQQICCMCVKEPSLEGMVPGSGDGGGDDSPRSDGMNAGARPIRLRQLKTLERQSTHKAASSTGSPRSRTAADASGSDDIDEEAVDEDSCGSADDSDYGDADDSVQCDADQHVPVVDDNDAAAIGIGGKGCDYDDKDDPFLRAIGGRENLLVGEAYQQRLLLERLHLTNESEPEPLHK